MKILFIRFSSIGDIILCTPVMRCTKTQLNAEIHFLTKQPYHSLVQPLPFIDKVITIESRVDPILPLLKNEKYDHIVDLHNNLRTALIKLRLGIPAYTFPKLNIRKWLFVNLKWNTLPNLHIVDRYFKAVYKFGVANDGKGLSLVVKSQLESILMSVIPEHLAHLPVVGLVLGATYYTKRIPAELLKCIIDRKDICFVLVGGQNEKSLGGKLEKLGDHIINICGHTSLEESIAMISKMDLIITGDTGMMHAAAAFKKKIIVLWGNTTPAFGMFPYQTPYQSFEVEGLSCRPCSKLGSGKCPKGHFRCMLDHDTDAVQRSITRFLKMQG